MLDGIEDIGISVVSLTSLVRLEYELRMKRDFREFSKEEG